MRLAFCILILLQLCSATRGQNLDSLETQLSKVTGKAHIGLLLELADKYLFSDEVKSIRYGNEAAILSETLPYPTGTVKAFRVMGRAYGLQAEFQKSFYYLIRSTKLAREFGDTLMVADNAISVAFVYSELGQYDKVLEYDLAAYKIYKSLGDRRGISNALTGIGIVYAEENKYDSALRNFKKALEYFEELKLTGRQGMANLNIGSLYGQMNDTVKSIEFYSRALANFKSSKSESGIAAVQQGLGKIYLKNGKLKEAKSLIDEAFAIRQKRNNQTDMLACMHVISKIYLIEKKFNSSQEYANRALTIAQKLKLHKEMADIYFSLAKIHESLNDFKNAYRYHFLATASLDSASLIEKSRRIHGLEVSSLMEKDKAQIDKLEQEKAIKEAKLLQATWQKAFLLALALSLVVISIFVFKLYKAKKSWAQILEKKNDWISNQKKKIEGMNLGLELQTFRSKLDTHLIFNVLNGVRNLINSSNKDKGVEYLGNATRFIRTALQNSMKDWVTLAEEISFVDNYLKIEQFRFPGRFEYRMEVDSEISDSMVPFMSLQPYVENAILHGVSTISSGVKGLILITASKYENGLLVSIEDNGIGRSMNIFKENDVISMGSYLVQGRLKKLSAASGNQMTVDIEDLFDTDGHPSGTRVNIYIALRKETVEYLV
ncbi:hypothetical protein WSM22_39070 [Cytophagales bacterium WSM2-2]|nr:hypothetical protein WSM22_39070 [Cytophagales bacterium WSM2-2]